MHSRQAQVTVEYFILFTAVAVLSIAGIAALRDENVGIRKTVGDFMTAAATKIAHDDVKPPPPAQPPPGQCGPGQCLKPVSCGEADCPGVCVPCCPAGQCPKPDPLCPREEVCPDVCVPEPCSKPPPPEHEN